MTDSAAIHEGPILATVFDGGSDRFYSASVEGAVVLRDSATGSVLRRWVCHRGPVTDLAFDARQDRLITAGHDHAIGVWDAASGASVHTLRGHHAGVFAVAVRQDAIASASFDGSIRIWDASSGRCLGSLGGHTDAVTDVDFLTDDVIVSASRDRTVRLWNWRTSALLRVFVGHTRWVTRIVPQGDGRFALSASEDGTIRRWDCSNGTVVDVRSVPQGWPIWGLAVDRRGRHAIAGAAGSTTLWSIGAALADTPILISGATSRAIAFDATGESAALGNDDEGVVLYDVAAQKPCRTLPNGSHGVISLAVDPISRLAAIGHRSGAVIAGRRPRACDDAHIYFAYALIPLDRGRFASGAFDGQVQVRDFEQGTLVRTFDHGAGVFSLGFAAAAGQLLSGGTDRIKLWDLESGRLLWERASIGSGAHTMADLSADATRVVSVGEDDLLRIWGVSDGRVRTLQLGTDLCSAIKLLPDGETAVVGTAHGCIVWVDLRDGKIRLLHAQHEDWVRSLRISRNGRSVISASQQGVCRAYDLVADQLLPCEILASQAIPAVDFVDDAHAVIATGTGQLHTVRVRSE